MSIDSIKAQLFEKEAGETMYRLEVLQGRMRVIAKNESDCYL